MELTAYKSRDVYAVALAASMMQQELAIMRHEENGTRATRPHESPVCADCGECAGARSRAHTHTHTRARAHTHTHTHNAAAATPTTRGAPA